MHQPWAAHDTQVLVVAVLGLALVVVLIVVAKMHAFLALTISSLLVGIFSGISFTKVTTSFETGVGGVLGYVGVLIALGAMLDCSHGQHQHIGLLGCCSVRRVDRFPDPENSDHLARVRPVDATPSADLARLAPSIPLRHTDRRRFAVEPVDPHMLDTLVAQARGCGAELHIVTGDTARARLIATIARSASLQRQQAGYGAELARWTGRYSAAADGIESSTVAAGIDLPGDVPMRHFIRRALSQPAHSLEHTDASVLLVLAARTGDRLGTLRAGEATGAVLLAATGLGLATTPLSQPMEVAATRDWIIEHIVGPGVTPQLVIRVGWADPEAAALPPTPRRSVERVMLRKP